MKLFLKVSSYFRVLNLKEQVAAAISYVVYSNNAHSFLESAHLLLTQRMRRLLFMIIAYCDYYGRTQLQQ